MCDVKTVDKSHAQRSKAIIGNYDQLAMMDVSAVSVPFFKWVGTEASSKLVLNGLLCKLI